MKHLLSAWVAAAMVGACHSGDPATVPADVRAATDGIDSAQLAADVTYLASDALRGRATPSPGLDSAIAYVVRRAEKSGLRPGGDGSTFLQAYTVRRARLDPANTWLDINGTRFREGIDFRVVNFRDSATVTAGLTYVGHGVRAAKKGIDPYASVVLRDRIIVAHGPGVMPKGETFATLGGMMELETAQLVADTAGAGAVLYLVPPRIMARWSQMPTQLGRESTELDPALPGAFAAARVPVLWVTPKVADAILSRAPAGASTIRAAADRGEFVKSFVFPENVRASLHIATQPATAFHPSNVVAVIEGSDAKLRDEYVVIAAHLDGAVSPIGRGTDSIYNAADDNASGSAALLSIAGAMMRAPHPRRSVMFVWDTGEEVGLWGSRYFASRSPVSDGNTVAYFNVDMIGRSKKPGTTVEGEEELAGPDEIQLAGPRALSTSVDSIIERANRDVGELKLDHRFDVAGHEYLYPRTDAAPALEHGVITINVMNGEHEDYHGPGDEASKLDVRRMRRVARFVTASAWMIANARERPVMDKGLPAGVRRAK